MPVWVTRMSFVVALALFACAGSPASSPASSPAPAVSPATSTPAGACAASTAPTTIQATVKDYAFGPDPIQAKVGDVISWTNSGPNEHTATLDDGSCGTDNLNTGDAGSLTFSAPGTYAYHCEVHPARMKGTIVVSG
ncbi:MAG TPA: cupredoxin domain-containing protein [Candidatus Eisenbacteria bacterium]|nr:cupredoxin domain-containing protein [Candidatus Eisenbacteria bacterium]